MKNPAQIFLQELVCLSFYGRCGQPHPEMIASNTGHLVSGRSRLNLYLNSDTAGNDADPGHDSYLCTANIDVSSPINNILATSRKRKATIGEKSIAPVGGRRRRIKPSTGSVAS